MKILNIKQFLWLRLLDLNGEKQGRLRAEASSEVSPYSAAEQRLPTRCILCSPALPPLSVATAAQCRPAGSGVPAPRGCCSGLTLGSHQPSLGSSEQPCQKSLLLPQPRAIPSFPLLPLEVGWGSYRNLKILPPHTPQSFYTLQAFSGAAPCRGCLCLSPHGLSAPLS